jgi:hypothetical protein
MPTKIKMSDVKVDGDSVIVHGKGGTALANSLVQKNGTTLAELAEKHGLVQPHEISIGGDGTVQIHSAKIAASVRGRLANPGLVKDDEGFFDTNCSCGGGGTTTSSW